MNGILVDDVDGWAVSADICRDGYEITRDGGVDHGCPSFVHTIADVQATIGHAAFLRLSPVPAGVPMCEAV